MQRIQVIAWVVITVLISACGSQKKVTPRGTDNKKAYMLFGEALKQFQLYEFDKSLDLINKAIAKDPSYIEAYDLKGNIFMTKERYEEAKGPFQKILQLDPDNVFALKDLSKAHFELHEYDDALRNLNYLLSIVGPGDERLATQKRIAQAEFAKKAYANPVPYEPVNVGPKINTKLEEYFPGLDIAEESLYFTRRDGSVNLYEQNEDLYVSAWGDDKSWQQAKSLGPPVNTRENEGAFSASPDGRYLFFTSCARPGGEGRCDIWVTTRSGEKWSEPRNLGRPVNTRDWESQPSISADGVTLFFASDRPGGFGGIDIWSCQYGSNGWETPVNLGPKINTDKDEQFPFIHPDGQTLYFSSEGLPGMGGTDIYFTRLKNGEWSTPVNLGYPINTSKDEWNFIVNRKGDMAYFASEGIEPNYGGMDIYALPLYEGARPNKTSYVKGYVYDIKTNKRLQAQLVLLNTGTGKEETRTTSDSKDGNFIVNLPANNDYALEAKADGYLFHSENFSLAQSNLDEPFVLKVGLKPIEKDQNIVMKNVLFEVDKANLKPVSYAELNYLVRFLKNNPNITIEIGGHTDNTGSESRNKTLSNDRAKAVYSYLIEKGIDANRLSYKGYGSAVPVATNDTDEGRQQNRRTEIKIVTH